MEKAVIYARVSTQEQEREGYSIPAQIKAIRKFALDNGITIEKEFIEAESAYKSGRHEFQRLLSYAKNRNIDCIIAHKVDRIARNLDDLATLERLGLNLKFVEQKFDDSPTGKFSYGIMALLAKLYSDNLSQEVKKGMYEKLTQGGFPGRAPLGYLNNRNTRSIVIDRQKADLIRYAFESYSDGTWSLKTLCKELYIKGLKNREGKRVYPSSLNVILRNPFYYGYMKMQNKLYKGNHQPLISKATFDRVQMVLDGFVHKKKTTHFFALRGFLICGECGAKITAEKQRGHNYYRCTKAKGSCSQKYAREEELFKQVNKILKKIEIEKEFTELLLEGCKILEQGEKDHTDKLRKELQNKYKAITLRIDSLVDSYLDNKVPEDIYLSKLNKLQEDRSDIEIKIDGLENNGKQSFEHVEELLKIANGACQIFINGDDRQKRDVLNLVSSNMVMLNKNIVSYQLKEPFNHFEIDPKEDKTQVTWALLDLNQ